MKVYTALLLLAFFPIPTDAILAPLFDLILGIFFPNWRQRLCDGMTSQLGSFTTDCTCTPTLSGFLDFDLTLACNDVGSTPCDLSLKGGANLFTAIFTGVGWTGTSICTLPGIGSVNFKLDGTVTLSDPADIDTCTVGLTVPAFPSTVIPGCTCTPGCSTSNPFSVSLSCSATGSFLGVSIPTTNFLNVPCQNALAALDAIDGITLPTFP